MREVSPALTINQHYVSLLHTLISQHSCKCLYLLQDLIIRISLLRVRNRTIPNDSRMVAMANQDMPIDTIVACRGECSAGFLVPMEVGALFSPERFGIAEGTVLDLVLRMVGGRHDGRLGFYLFISALNRNIRGRMPYTSRISQFERVLCCLEALIIEAREASKPIDKTPAETETEVV